MNPSTMDPIQIILLIQNLGTWLLVPMKAASFFGNLEFYLLVAPALYWCLDTGAGLRFGLTLIFTGTINHAIKLVFHMPRPFWVSAQVHPYAPETSFGLPSGHAQNSVVVFGTLAHHFKSWWAWAGVFVLAVLIGFSRLYLGVHFLGDVLAGWFIGLILLLLILWAEPPVLAWFRNKTEPVQYLVVFLASLAVIGAGWVIYTASASFVLPPEWIANVHASLPAEEPFDPWDFSGFVSNGGTILGLAGGAIYLHQRGGYPMRGKPLQLILRYLVGVIGLIVIFFGLDALFPQGESLLAYLFRYIRYGLVGLWISLLAPLIFKKFRLMD